MLELRPNCELCDRDLPPTAPDARICPYECTFCAACVDDVAGERVPELRRQLPAAADPPGARLARDDRARQRPARRPPAAHALHARGAGGVLGRPARRPAGGAVKPNRSIPSATVIPVLIYPDVREAVAWLTAAFGFAERREDRRGPSLADERPRRRRGDHRRRPPRPRAAARGRVDPLGGGARRRREGALRPRPRARRARS